MQTVRVFFFFFLLLSPKDIGMGVCTRIRSWNKIRTGPAAKTRMSPLPAQLPQQNTERGSADSCAGTQTNLHALNITWNSP